MQIIHKTGNEYASVMLIRSGNEYSAYKIITGNKCLYESMRKAPAVKFYELTTGVKI